MGEFNRNEYLAETEMPPNNYKSQIKTEIMADMKKSKVQSVIPTGTFKSDYGTDLGDGTKGFYKFEYLMEDGAVVNASHKSKEAPFKPGDEVEYTITNAEYNNGKVSKPEEKKFQRKSGGGSNASFALSYAKDYHTANGVLDASDPAGTITATADKFLAWLNQNS